MTIDEPLSLSERLEPPRRGRLVAIAGPEPIAARRAQGGLRLAVKRAIDVALACIGLVATAPVMAVVALAIKADSRGPVLYVSERIGRGGTPIRLLKFRSMAHGASVTTHQSFLEASRRGAVDQEHHKVDNDPRVTRVGAVIRRLSLDELPQLINVLRGDMSLVGPRPDLPYALDLYRPTDWQRFEVLPGITGLWQVSGRSALSVEEMYRLDREYVAGWSIRTDLKILARTVPALLKLDTSG